MRLLETSTLELEEFFDADIPIYAILSHRWGENEVNFKQMLKRTAPPGPGLEKLQKCCSLADSRGFRCVWIDTCCIDRRSSSELTEAINSMYKWYRNAAECYVYLNDVQITTEELRLRDLIMRGSPPYAMKDVDYKRLLRYFMRIWGQSFAISSGRYNTVCHTVDYDEPAFEDSYRYLGFSFDDCTSHIRERFRASSWFTRGWTLQELLAPAAILFYDVDWEEIGTRTQLAADIATVLKNITERDVVFWDPDLITSRR